MRMMMRALRSCSVNLVHPKQLQSTKLSGTSRCLRKRSPNSTTLISALILVASWIVEMMLKLVDRFFFIRNMLKCIFKTLYWTRTIQCKRLWYMECYPSQGLRGKALWTHWGPSGSLNSLAVWAHWLRNTHFDVKSPSIPTGPLAWIRPVLIPTSAPKFKNVATM